MCNLLLVLALCILLAGCVTEGPPPAPPPRDLPPQPASVRANRIVLTVPSIPEDTDRNGYFDLLAATVYVFDDSYVAPIAVPGSFEFRLTDSKGKELAKWAFDSERSAAAQRRFLVGPGYLFQLDLLAALGPGGDRLNATEGQLAVTLISPDGSRLSPRASTSVAVGSTR